MSIVKLLKKITFLRIAHNLGISPFTILYKLLSLYTVCCCIKKCSLKHGWLAHVWRFHWGWGIYCDCTETYATIKNYVFSWKKSKAMPGLILLVQQQCGFVDICWDRNTIYVDNDDKLWTFLLDMDYLTGEINVTTASQCLSQIGYFTSSKTVCMFCVSL